MVTYEELKKQVDEILKEVKKIEMSPDRYRLIYRIWRRRGE